MSDVPQFSTLKFYYQTIVFINRYATKVYLRGEILIGGIFDKLDK